MRVLRVILLLTCFLAVMCLSGLAQNQPAAPAPDARSDSRTAGRGAPAAKADAVARPVAAPADFVKRYDELLALLAVIDRIERESGLRALREQASRLAAELRAGVPAGMSYNPDTEKFEAIERKEEKPK